MSITLYQDDCLSVLQTLPDGSIDAVLTDPPYGLSDYAPADVVACLTAWLNGEVYRHNKTGFMGQEWDSWVPGPEIWRECLRVLKPGGNLLAFAGARSIDLMGMSVRLAGFEIKDSFAWINSQGMPKGQNIGAAVAKSKAVAATETAPGQGWHSALKPCFEPCVMARKPLEGTLVQNMLKHGVAGYHIDACRLPIYSDEECEFSAATAVGRPLGRFAPNVAHDDSPEVNAAFASVGEKKSGVPGKRRKAHTTHSMSGNLNLTGEQEVGYGDSGSAARFFYAAKVTSAERGSSKHPTQKPVSLMRYLARLITPTGGVLLDPFAGSGTTGQAALDEGFEAILVEREQEYADHIRQRLNFFITADIGGE